MNQSRYPKPGRSVSLSGTPRALAHVKQIGPEYNAAAAGERKQEPVRRRPSRLRPAFGRAHEGPREAPSVPRLQPVPAPHATIVAEVHAQVEREKQARNRERDLQMKKWRERKIVEPSPGRQPRPQHRQQQPEVFGKLMRQRAVRRLLENKHDRGGQSR